jgi:DNA repair exonuclease SbcCD ATPase subunit
MKEEYDRQNLLNSVLANRPSDRDYESEIKMLNDKLTPLTSEAHSCPAGANCPFIKPIQAQIAYFVEQIQDKQKKRDELEKAKSKYQIDLAAVPPIKVTEADRKRYIEIKTKTKELAMLENDITNATIQIMSVPSKGIEVKELNVLLQEKNLLAITNDSLLITLEREIEKLNLNSTTQKTLDVKKDIKNLEDQKDTLKNTISKSFFAMKITEDMTKEIKDLQKKIKNDSIEVGQLEAIKDAFGSKGLKTVVVDYLIPRLEERINEILSKLSDFTVRLDTQKTSADGEGTIEGLYINITDQQGQETGFDSFSGGEKVKITIAISEALASLQKCGFRILDEAVIALDKESTESLVMVLGKIQERFNQMICISHLDEVKDIFEERIEVLKINGSSIISK